MGHIRIDKRFGDIRVVFYVGNGRKDIPKKVVIAKDTSYQSLFEVIEPVLAALRPKPESSEILADSSNH